MGHDTSKRMYTFLQRFLSMCETCCLSLIRRVLVPGIERTITSIKNTETNVCTEFNTQNPHTVLLVSKVLTLMSATRVLGSKLGLNPEHRMDVNSVAQQLE